MEEEDQRQTMTSYTVHIPDNLIHHPETKVSQEMQLCLGYQHPPFSQMHTGTIAYAVMTHKLVCSSSSSSSPTHLGVKQ
jgi:hypothetical protein